MEGPLVIHIILRFQRSLSIDQMCARRGGGGGEVQSVRLSSESADALLIEIRHGGQRPLVLRCWTEEEQQLWCRRIMRCRGSDDDETDDPKSFRGRQEV